MINVQDAAKYFLLRANEDEDTSISNLKLQKLIYYAQAFHLAIFEEPLFDEEFEAWTHGPVCPEVYHLYKEFGSDPIKFEVNLKIFSQEQLDILDEVNEILGQFSAWKLRNISHEDEPWKEREATAGVIEKTRMIEFYKTRLK